MIDVCRTSQNQPTISFNKKHFLASRVMFSLTKGAIPNGLFVMHTCDNGACVNPSHLWLGTQKDNIQDCVRKYRRWNSKLIREQILEIRRLGKSGVSSHLLAKQFNITHQYASRIVRNIQPEYVK